jgi:hypothetical protein
MQTPRRTPSHHGRMFQAGLILAAALAAAPPIARAATGRAGDAERKTSAAKGAPAAPAAAPSAAAQTFEHLKTLAGEWQGTDASGTTVRASYEVVSGGTALVERLDMEGEGHPAMITVYHLDGDHLMMTHYCGAGNQPRMVAREMTPQEVRFEFLDATSLASPNGGHMHRLVLKFTGDNTLTAEWTWRDKGKDGVPEVMKLTRAGA